MTRLTPNGKLFLGVSLLLYLAAVTSHSGLILLPLGILWSCYLVNWYQAAKMVRHLHIIAPKSLQVREGDRPSEPWCLKNNGNKPIWWIQCRQEKETLLKVNCIGSQDSVSQVPELVCRHRGVFPYNRLTVVCHYPFGLVEVGRHFPLEGELLVYPAVYETFKPPASGYDSIVGGKFKGQRQGRTGTDFSGVRPFQTGDSWKQIHWKTSSKGLGLMVKNFDEELSGRVAFLLDVDFIGREAIFDNALRAAGSMMFQALDEGNHVEWVDLGTMHRHVIPPFLDGSEILEGMARIKSVQGSLHPGRLREAVQMVSKRSSLILVLGNTFEGLNSLLEEWKSAGRRCVICLPGEQQDHGDQTEGELFFYQATRLVRASHALHDRKPLTVGVSSHA